jgi:biopolymer transport protein TolR
MAPVNKPLRGRRRLMSDINVVPYIDVMLVLLIIFMITAPLLTQGIKVDLPRAQAEPVKLPREDAEPMVMSVDAAGRLYLNIGASPESPLDEATFRARATAALRRNPQRTVLVKGDKRASYGRMVEAMVLLQSCGATKLGFLTDPPPPVDSRKP